MLPYEVTVTLRHIAPWHSSKKKTITIALALADDRLLSRAAHERGVSGSEFIGQHVALALERYRRRPNGQIEAANQARRSARPPQVSRSLSPSLWKNTRLLVSPNEVGWSVYHTSRGYDRCSLRSARWRTRNRWSICARHRARLVASLRAGRLRSAACSDRVVDVALDHGSLCPDDLVAFVAGKHVFRNCSEITVT